MVRVYRHKKTRSAFFVLKEVRNIFVVTVFVYLKTRKMADKFSARQVKRFDGINYQGWKFQITVELIANEIFHVVDGSRVMPANREGGNEELAKTWTRDNAKAMAIISSAMEHPQLENVLVCTSAKQMWDKLSHIHEQKSVTNKLLLTQRFHEYRMTPTDSVVQHISKVQNMARQ